MANTKSLKNVLGTVSYSGTELTNMWRVVYTSDNSQISFYDEYSIMETDRWDTISQKFYQTPHLWWLICNYNKIKDPFADLVAGNTIKIIKRELLTPVLHKLRGLTN